MEDNEDTKDEVLNVTVEEPKDLNIEGLDSNYCIVSIYRNSDDSWQVYDGNYKNNRLSIIDSKMTRASAAASYGIKHSMLQ